MKSFVGCFIGLVLSVSVGAEPLLEGRVRLSSGEPAAGVQVRLFDLTDLSRFVGTTTDEAGHFSLSLQTFSTDRGPALPTSFALGQNYPNPFNPSTIIPYQLPTAGHVRLEVFNLLGQRLATLVNGERSAGAHTAQWDGTDAAGRAVGAGVYIYRLSGDGHAMSRRMVLIDGQAGVPRRTIREPVQALEGAVEADDGVYGLTVSGAGLVAYVNPAFRVGINEADIVIEESGEARMKRMADGVLGDVDGNGQVDVFDALFVLLYSVDSSITLPNNGDISLGDVNGDGRVDTADAALLIRYIRDPSDPALPPGIGPAGSDLVSSIGGTPVNPDTTLSKIYWASPGYSGKICRADMDGSNIDTLFTTNYIGTFTVDGAGGKLYCTAEDKGIHVIYRVNVDGSNIDTLFSGLRDPQDIAYDTVEGKIYWLDGGREGIYRTNVDTFNPVETLITGVENLGTLSLDEAGRKMYWSANYGIYRTNMDGSNIDTLFFGATSQRRDFALDMAGGIYWTASYKIWHANLTDMESEQILVPYAADGLALDMARGKIYWTWGADGKIYRANLDGFNDEVLIDQYSQYYSLIPDIVLGP